MRKRNLFLVIVIMGCLSAAGCGKQGKTNTTVVEDGTGSEKMDGMESTVPKPSDQSETDSGIIADGKTDLGKGDGTVVIGEETAKKIALEAAGVLEDEITNLHVVRERDDGIDVYDVEFYAASQEYDYEIDAYTGEIRSFDHEMERE